MFKKRQARDTSTDNTTPKYEMEGNPCYEATAVKQTTDTHLYEAVRGGGAKWKETDQKHDVCKYKLILQSIYLTFILTICSLLEMTI